MQVGYRCRTGTWLAGALLLAVVASGCGGKPIYAVRGVIVDPEGNPVTGLEGGSVELESIDGNMSAQGPIDADGRFVVTTERAGDGAHTGKNRVKITRPYFNPETPKPRVIEAKYEEFETSGLDINVEPRTNDVKLNVQLYKGRK